MTTQIATLIPTQENTTGLQLCPITINADYRKKWNIHQDDFVHLTLNGKLVNNTLYRVGGINKPNFLKDDYFMLIKHVEAYYDDAFMETCGKSNFFKPGELKKEHLEYQWCIIDKNGVEKVNFKQFDSPYLQGGQIYSIDDKYYNIETAEFYCKAYTCIKSSEFIFLDNAYDKDETRRGVMRINKKDGTWKLYK